jgi:outer membrane protein, heavy metal efflux system
MPNRPALTSRAITAVSLLTTLLLSGCVLAPPQTADEQNRLEAAGHAHDYETPIDRRTLPDLPAPASWQDVLHRAFLANGALEAAYFDWKAALQRIPQVANWPNTNLAPTFSYMFSGERMKAFDRATVNVAFDPMENLSFPTKTAQAGKVALSEARAAGRRFEVKKFEIQQKVLTAYLDLVLHEEKIRIQRDNVSLLKLLSDTAADRVRAGGARQDLLKSQTEHRLAQNQLSTMQSQHMAMRAMLNGMLARDPNAALELPPGLPTPRPLPADDARLIAAATDNNPELSALAAQVRGRADALELARMAYIPDINPIAAFTGGVSQMIGAMVVIPTTLPEIRGRIDESRALLRSTEAMLRQTRSDRAAGFVAALYTLRNSERQAAFLEQQVLPQAQQVLDSARQAYATGAGSFIDLIDSRRTLLDIRLLIAEQKIERETRLAELETLAGIDVETLAAPATQPATRPQEVPSHD